MCRPALPVNARGSRNEKLPPLRIGDFNGTAEGTAVVQGGVLQRGGNPLNATPAGAGRNSQHVTTQCAPMTVPGTDPGAGGNEPVQDAALAVESGSHGVESIIPLQEMIQVEPGPHGIGELEAGFVQHGLGRGQHLAGLFLSRRRQGCRNDARQPANPYGIILENKPSCRPMPNHLHRLCADHRKGLQGYR